MQKETPTNKNAARGTGPLAPGRVAAILKALDEAYPEAVCALTHRSPWELLVATILSAQCTDVRVNMVTPELFRRYPTPAAMAKATPAANSKELIRTTGFFRNKAKSIQGAAKKIVADFNGQVPQTLAELITIPGAARKTANVVLGVCFRKSRRRGCRYARFSHRAPAGAGQRRDAGKGGAGADACPPAGSLDQLLSPDHPPRPPGLHRPQPQMRPLQPGAALPLEGQDVGVVRTSELASQRVSGMCECLVPAMIAAFQR